MRSIRWTAAALAAGLLTTLLAATAPSQATGPAKAAGTPAVGECRQITLKQAGAKSNTTAPIPCSQRHDIRTILVKDLPSGMTWDNATAEQIARLGITECYPAMRHALGQSDTVRDRTMYGTFFFEPTQSQRAAGANWIRCDLALFNRGSLASLPTDRVPALSSRKLPNSVARCAAGPDSALKYVVCGTAHRYRAVGAFTITKSRYPGRSALIRIGRHRCPHIVGRHRYFYSWSDKQLWNLVHDHTMVCYAQRSN
jgi:hypothetical protein